MKITTLMSTLVLLFCLNNITAQDKSTTPWAADNFSGLKMRSIGPALMAGRIADIAIHPENDNTWFVAVASGGVWKTKNAGVTWTPIFDNESSYSTGCITIDPANPHVVWVGTGENDGGRHIGYGDGVYKSEDGGHTWKNMGLKQSEHVSKIIIHPENSDVIWVASQGPLWTKGGQRGVYKSTDGGATWKRTLGNDEWTGATELVIDPRNPDRLYAATWDRHRTIAAFMSGGPGSGLHRSDDGGETWVKLSTGLPTSNMGKIGLAISPQQPDVIYAAIELDRRTGALYRSADRGATWEKRANAVSGATGPHYYQELYACPHKFDRLYLMDVRIQVSDDGGHTFRRLKEEHKHSDNHALAFRKDDPDYLLVGTDGGIYESFDLAENWRFIENLPITQFYKVAVDDAEPFYNIYGGTQDNSTQGGPVRTDNVQGIQNSDWRVVLNWDGHQPATEPGNPNIIYGQRQQGTLSRIDMITGEVVDVQPQPAADEDFERFNWDAPIFISPHSPTRVYFASQRLWRSDNRGDSWTAVSGDLTKNQTRLELPIMGKVQSWDNPWDVTAMSNFNTITSIAESPKQEGMLYIGTDDGLIQISEDGGKNWRKVAVSSLPGVSANAYVNDIKADLFDASTAYIALDNHKYGDYKPYVLKTTDKGKTWKSIASNLPDRHLVWRVVQDHVNKDLLFAATEFGIFFTPSCGGEWVKLQGGVPTISFRDLAIQRRENDLVGASFGRSYYVLDDYSALRDVSEAQLQAEATLFPVRKAWWYIPRSKLGFDGKKGDQGAGHYVADNPPFGAVFTYHLSEDLATKKATRTEEEKNLAAANQSISFPGWDALDEEKKEAKPMIWMIVKDSYGSVVRRVESPTTKGFHRVAWDLRYPAPDAINLDPRPAPMFGGGPQGLLAAPGTYTVTMAKEVDGVLTELSSPQKFEVVPLRKGALEGASPADLAAFWNQYEGLARSVSAVSLALSNAGKKTMALKKALNNSKAPTGALDQRWHSLHKDLFALNQALYGNLSKQEIGEKTKPTIGSRLFAVSRTIDNSTYGPTATAQQNMKIIANELSGIQSKLKVAETQIEQLAKDLMEAGAPAVEGAVLPNLNK
ncbi:MAG: glycosyl hydrolase [Bacteroidota bacterium]